MAVLYSKTKIFHFKDKLDSLPHNIDTIMAPLHIRLKPTNICNHDCWYCAYRKENIQLGKDMISRDQIPRDKIMELIEDFATVGVKAVTFSGGGEPLCYPYLFDVIFSLCEKNIKFACLTNGSRLNGDIARIFSEKGTWIRVSMDGWDAQSYAAYRNVSEGEFNKVMANLENFKKLKGPCYLGVIIVVDNKNAPHIYSMIKNLKGIGVNSVKVSPCIVSNDGDESNAYQRPHFENVVAQIESAQADFADDTFEIFNSYHLQLGTFEKDYSWCPYIQINPVIGADLNVYSCHDKAYNLGNGLICSLKEGRFREIWFSGKHKFFKINPILHCQHHCVVNEKNKLILEYFNTAAGHLNFV